MVATKLLTDERSTNAGAFSLLPQFKSAKNALMTATESQHGGPQFQLSVDHQPRSSIATESPLSSSGFSPAKAVSTDLMVLEPMGKLCDCFVYFTVYCDPCVN